MSNLIRTTCYLTPENKKLWKKVAYLCDDKGKSEILNYVLEIGFEKFIKELKEKEKK